MLAKIFGAIKMTPNFKPPTACFTHSAERKIISRDNRDDRDDVFATAAEVVTAVTVVTLADNLR